MDPEIEKRLSAIDDLILKLLRSIGEDPDNPKKYVSVPETWDSIAEGSPPIDTSHALVWRQEAGELKAVGIGGFCFKIYNSSQAGLCSLEISYGPEYDHCLNYFELVEASLRDCQAAALLLNQWLRRFKEGKAS